MHPSAAAQPFPVTNGSSIFTKRQVRLCFVPRDAPQTHTEKADPSGHRNYSRGLRATSVQWLLRHLTTNAAGRVTRSSQAVAGSLVAPPDLVIARNQADLSAAYHECPNAVLTA